MKGKWFIVGLVLLGLVAALSAAILVGVLQFGRRAGASRGPAPPAPVEIVLAKKALPAMAVVDGRSVVTKTVPKQEAPADYVASPGLVVGKVLAVPMTEGQVFTKGCFVTKGSGPQLAAALPNGMRAVSLSLPGWSGLEGLLYPGSVVDVYASLRDPTASGRPIVSTVLVQGVQVLAVEHRTVFTEEKKEGQTRTVPRRYPLVTLMVNPEQARALQLAMQHGSMSLAMRNPLDRQSISLEPMWISDILRYPHLAEQAHEPDEEVEPAPTQPAVALRALRGKWDVLIIRGGQREEQSFELPTKDVGREKREGA